MIHSAGTSWPLSQAILSLPTGLMNKVVMEAGTQVMHRLCISVSWSGSDTTEDHMCQQQRPTLSPSMAPLLGWMSAYCAEPCGQHFVLTRTDTGYRLAFRAQCFGQNYNTYRMLYPPLGYLTQHCLWWKNSLHSRRNMAAGPCWYHLLTLPRSLLSWTVDSPFEDSITKPAGWQQHAGLRRDSLESCVCSESSSDIWCYFSHTWV